MTTITTLNPVPVATEWHSSDLTASCLRSVELRHEGKIVGETPTAMLRGMWSGEVLSCIHNTGFDFDETLIVESAFGAVEEAARVENRPITDGANNALADIERDVRAVCDAYVARFKPMFAKCHVIGTEVPIRFEFECDGETVAFASHLDLLFRDWNGEYVVWDWKYRDESPTVAYLVRNPQFACYAFGVAKGSVLIDPMTDTWHSIGQWPRVSWIDLPSLKPYGKAITAPGDDGNERQYKKGDARPLRAIVRTVDYSAKSEAPILDMLRMRHRMLRAGFWPANPDPIGCHICPSRQWCSTLAGEPNGTH